MLQYPLAGTEGWELSRVIKVLEPVFKEYHFTFEAPKKTDKGSEYPPQNSGEYHARVFFNGDPNHIALVERVRPMKFGHESLGAGGTVYMVRGYPEPHYSFVAIGLTLGCNKIFPVLCNDLDVAIQKASAQQAALIEY
ncbi:MAG: hypothetical protein HY832_02345 [Candidatus Aenigmarchaeota archaeon]|nr:hypothetical protein [Candidatus Aenigmarchaeota archaeon]